MSFNVAFLNLNTIALKHVTRIFCVIVYSKQVLVFSWFDKGNPKQSTLYQ